MEEQFKPSRPKPTVQEICDKMMRNDSGNPQLHYGRSMDDVMANAAKTEYEDQLRRWQWDTKQEQIEWLKRRQRRTA
jgi:hypothetical protein